MSHLGPGRPSASRGASRGESAFWRSAVRQAYVGGMADPIRPIALALCRDEEGGILVERGYDSVRDEHYPPFVGRVLCRIVKQV